MSNQPKPQPQSEPQQQEEKKHGDPLAPQPKGIPRTPAI